MSERVLPIERSVVLADYPHYLLTEIATKASAHLDGDTIADIYTACMTKLERLEMHDPEYDPVLQLSQEAETVLVRVGYRS